MPSVEDRNITLRKIMKTIWEWNILFPILSKNWKNNIKIYYFFRKRSLTRLKSEYSGGRERFNLTLRLFILMGGLWIFELIVSSIFWK